MTICQLLLPAGEQHREQRGFREKEWQQWLSSYYLPPSAFSLPSSMSSFSSLFRGVSVLCFDNSCPWPSGPFSFASRQSFPLSCAVAVSWTHSTISFQHMPFALIVFKNSTCGIRSCPLLWDIFVCLFSFLASVTWLLCWLLSSLRSLSVCVSFSPYSSVISGDVTHSSPVFFLSNFCAMAHWAFLFIWLSVTSKKTPNWNYSALSPTHPCNLLLSLATFWWFFQALHLRTILFIQ